RASGTSIWVSSTGTTYSSSRATPRAATASRANRWPSTRAPGTQQNSEPGTTARESCVMAATSVLAGSPRTSSTSTPPSSWSSSKEEPYRVGVGDGLSVVGVLAATAGEGGGEDGPVAR